MYSIATYRTTTDNKAEALSSKEFFTQNDKDYIWKLRIDIQNDKKRLYCGFCGQPLHILGGGKYKQRLHFRHRFRASENCIFKDDESLSKQVIIWRKYANEEESILHKESKRLIAKTLEKYGAETRIEQYIKDEQDGCHYRRPDVHAIFPNKDLVVEVQLTSTFLDVITGRKDFYQSHKMFLLWVVNEFRPDLFHQMDIFYSSKENIFVFDTESRKLTEQQGKLYLKCYYQSEYCDDKGHIIKNSNYQQELITFDDLTFNTEDYTVYYFDVEENKRQCEIEQRIVIKQLREEQEQLRKEQEAIRLKQEQEELERLKREQIEAERLKKEAEELQRKREAEQREQDRLDSIKKTQKEKLEDYVLRDLMTLDEYWQHYQQLNDEERKFADTLINDVFMNHVCHQTTYYYLPSYGRHDYNDENVNKLYDFLLQHDYSFDWHRLETIPELYFTQRDYYIDKRLYQKITFYLYINRNYHMPNWNNYYDCIENELNRIYLAACNNEEQYYADSFNNIKMLIFCFERLRNSSFTNDNAIFRKVYNNRIMIKRLFAIYLGEFIGEDYNEKRYYDPKTLSDRFVSPEYFHLYKRMIECRKRTFLYGLVPNLCINLKEIEQKNNYSGIAPNYDMDALMPILFPNIKWALQQSLF